MGLAPMTQPPGKGSTPSPNLPRRLPRRTIEDRIFFPSSLSATQLLSSLAQISRVPPCQQVLAPRSRSICSIRKTSAILGQPFNTVVPLFKRAAAIIGSAAFFEPCILTSPSKGIPPVILILPKLSTPASLSEILSEIILCTFLSLGDSSTFILLPDGSPTKRSPFLPEETALRSLHS